MIGLITNIRLFQPVQVTRQKNRDFIHLNFYDKGFDFINLSGILRSQSVLDNIPVYFSEKEPPTIGYRFNKSIAGKLFNYKQSLSEEFL